MSNIEKVKVSQDTLDKKGVATLRTYPSKLGTFGQNGLDAEALKQKFDELPEAIATQFNALCDILIAGNLEEAMAYVASINDHEATKEIFNLLSVIGDALAYKGKALATQEYTNGKVAGEAAARATAIQDEATARAQAISAEASARAQAISTEASARDKAIHEAISNLVGAAPDTLNTLAELADALQRNPDVVATLESAIADKASKKELAGKLDKTSTRNVVYATNGRGEQILIPVSSIGGGTKITVNGETVESFNADTKADAEDVNLLTKKVANLEAIVPQETHYTDAETAYIKQIPANTAPYALLTKVGGMVHAHTIIAENLFSDSVLSQESGKQYDDGNGYGCHLYRETNGSYSVTPLSEDNFYQSYYTEHTFGEIFPSAEAGKKYIFSYDVSEPWDEYWSSGSIGIPSVYNGVPFTLTEAIRNSRIDFYCASHYDGTMERPQTETFSNISLKDEQGDVRYLTEAKVTALDFVGKNLFDEKAITGGVNGNGAAWNEAVVVTDEYIKVTRGAYGNSLYLTPNQFFLQEGQSVSISADVFIPTGGAPTLGAVFGIGNPIKGVENSALYPKLSAYGQWERHAKTVKAKQSGWYYLGLQGDGNASQYDGMDVRFKNIKVTTDTTDTTYSPYHKHTFAIPEAVQALDGYGWGIPNGAHNGVEWDDEGKATFVKRVERVVYDGTENWSGGVGTAFYTSCYDKLPQIGKKGSTVMTNKWPWGSSSPSGYVDYSFADIIVVVPAQHASNDDEWKARLAQWAAEGDPLTVYYELAEQIVTDISHLITDDNLIPVEGGGVVIAQNENEEAAPTTINYLLK